jgi:hypothetical protein
MTRQTRTVFLAGALAVFSAVGCGKSPLAPTEVADLATSGSGPSITVVPTASADAPGREQGRVHLSAVTNDPITITVLQFPSLQTTVNPGETAVINGLPPGSYTLVFTQNGVTIGTQSIVGVQPGEQIQITVVFDGGSFVMVVVIIGNPTLPPPTPCTVDGQSVGASLTVEGVVVSGNAQAFREDRNGDHVQDLFDVQAASASYICVGRAKRGTCQSSLQAGSQVHVTGALLGCRGSVVVLNATEVKIQQP